MVVGGNRRQLEIRMSGSEKVYPFIVLSLYMKNLSFRVSYRDGVMEHEPKACAAVKGTQIMVRIGNLNGLLANFFL